MTLSLPCDTYQTKEKFDIERNEVIRVIENFLKTDVFDHYIKDEEIRRAFMEIWRFACERLKKMQYSQDIKEYRNVCRELYGIIPHC